MSGTGAAELGGRIAGGLLGGAIGSIFGPVGTWIGRGVGSRLGAAAGTAAAGALASMMEEQNKDAEKETQDTPAAQACANCEPPNRRHDPCRTRGKDRTKENNTVWDPEISNQVREEVDMIRNGLVPKDQGTWTMNGRTYGLHGKSVHPMYGDGFTNLSRQQHKLLRDINTRGYQAALDSAEHIKGRGDITQEEIDEVLDIVKKCGTS